MGNVDKDRPRLHLSEPIGRELARHTETSYSIQSRGVAQGKIHTKIIKMFKDFTCMQGTHAKEHRGTLHLSEWPSPEDRRDYLRAMGRHLYTPLSEQAHGGRESNQY